MSERVSGRSVWEKQERARRRVRGRPSKGTRQWRRRGAGEQQQHRSAFVRSLWPLQMPLQRERRDRHDEDEALEQPAKLIDQRTLIVHIWLVIHVVHVVVPVIDYMVATHGSCVHASASCEEEFANEDANLNSETNPWKRPSPPSSSSSSFLLSLL